MKTSAPPPIFVVDDDPGLRNSLRFLLNNSGRQVVSFESGEDFLGRHDSLDPGPVLLDVCLSGMSGLDVLQELVRRASPMEAILITGHGDIAMAVEAMKSGAFDFLTKPFSRDDLLESITNADRHLADRDGAEQHRRESETRLGILTPRELEVVNELARGLPNKSIGFELGISSRTVEIHRANAMRKLGTRSLADTLRIAFGAGLPLSAEDMAARIGQAELPLEEPEECGAEDDEDESLAVPPGTTPMRRGEH